MNWIEGVAFSIEQLAAELAKAVHEAGER